MKLGFVSLPVAGHLNPMTALGRKLQSRGNEVVFFGVPDVEPIVRAANLNFVPFCEKDYPVGSMTEIYGRVAKLHGEDVLRCHVEEIAPAFLKTALGCFPKKLAASGVEAMVLDMGHTFLQLVPLSLGIPYVHISNSLHIDPSGATPACIFSLPYENTPEAFAKNIEGLKKIGGYFAQILAAARPYAEKAGLQIDWNNPSATNSKLAVITQTPKEFDFPGIPWPAHFHYAGPFHDDEGREPVVFPREQLSGKPLIYASLGTLVNGLDHLYKAILEATTELPEFQLVLSVGQRINPDELRPIPSNAIIVRTAPQLELLKGAALCITHAGLNTALEALTQGVPMVALPIGYDQPGVAARIVFHGVGESLKIEKLTGEQLLEAMRKVLENQRYRERARYFQKVIAETRGLEVAADRIVQAFQTSQPVYRSA
jgi:MGT family glycosyltransferase